MKSQQDMRAGGAHQEKQGRSGKKPLCFVPEAYGMPAVELHGAASAQVVEMGVEAADIYLRGGYQGEGLAGVVARIRSAAPPKYWPDVEAGFLSRIEQCLRAAQGAPSLGREQKQEAFALGNQVMKALHDAAVRVSALADVGAIVPTSGQGQQQLQSLQAVTRGISWVCPAAPEALR